MSYPLRRISYKYNLPKDIEDLLASFTGKPKCWLEYERKELKKEMYNKIAGYIVLNHKNFFGRVKNGFTLKTGFTNIYSISSFKHALIYYKNLSEHECNDRNRLMKDIRFYVGADENKFGSFCLLISLKKFASLLGIHIYDNSKRDDIARLLAINRIKVKREDKTKYYDELRKIDKEERNKKELNKKLKKF